VGFGDTWDSGAENLKRLNQRQMSVYVYFSAQRFCHIGHKNSTVDADNSLLHTARKIVGRLQNQGYVKNNQT